MNTMKTDIETARDAKEPKMHDPKKMYDDLKTQLEGVIIQLASICERLDALETVVATEGIDSDLEIRTLKRQVARIEDQIDHEIF